MQNAAGALYTVNEVPAYNIGGNSELATIKLVQTTCPIYTQNTTLTTQ